MKSQLKLTTLALALVLSASVAQAKTKTTKETVKHEDVVTTTSAASHSSTSHSSNNMEIGAGLTSSDVFTGTTAASAVFILNDKHVIQPLLAVGGTNGGASFGIGGMYKYRLIGNDVGGFHLGGGFGLGTVGGLATTASSVSSAISSALTGSSSTTTTSVSTTAFRFAIGGVAGIYFKVANSVLFQFDAAPVLTIVSGTANFQLSSIGSLLGASVHYMF